jgi:hypothetical protein
VGELPTLGLLESVAVFGLGVVLGEAYNTGTLQVWYLLIDMHFIMFHEDFDDGLSVPVLKKRSNSTA